jgi:hypothetical protein
MFIRFPERRTAVFYDLCVIVRVVDVYQICREKNGYTAVPLSANLININNPNNNT